MVPTEVDRELARAGINVSLERTQGDHEAFIEEMIDLIACYRAEVRLVQNALHAREEEMLILIRKSG